ncbi:MAG: hypothetical protein ACSLEM_04565 [Candidatus Malihini olakiniferum]
MMAVEQPRHFFIQHDSYFTDNQAIGLDLAQHYWLLGNRVGHDDTLCILTEGKRVQSRLPCSGLQFKGEEGMATSSGCYTKCHATTSASNGANLHAYSKIADSECVLANNSGGDSAMCEAFPAFIKREYPSIR